MHLMISALIALVYGWGFENLTHRADWLVGIGFGFIHAIIAGVVMGMMPAMHPLMPEQVPAPGAFMSNLGIMGIAAEFMLHLIYGAIVRAMYGPVRGSASESKRSGPGEWRHKTARRSESAGCPRHSESGSGGRDGCWDHR
jgi:hypothetical protein